MTPTNRISGQAGDYRGLRNWQLESPMRVRVIVADQSEARFYDTQSPGGQLQLAGRLVDPAAHLHDRDLKSDRSGRVFERAGVAGRRRGAGAHHATSGERGPRKTQAQRFARRIVSELEEARRENRFDSIILMASPAFLGLLRDALPAALRATVAAEIHKDLVHQAASVVRAHLPKEAFTAHI